jgi:hypothetical protein
VIELQRFIVQQLKTVHPRVLLEFVPENQVVEYPYVVYNLPNSEEIVDRREDFILEVDVWDKPIDGSTVALQTLADTIHQKLNRLTYTDNANGWSSRFYLVNRLMLPDPDPMIRRRQLRYEIKVYRRNT